VLGYGGACDPRVTAQRHRGMLPSLAMNRDMPVVIDATDAVPRDPTDPIAASELARLQQRSDARGLLRLAGHLAAIGAAGALYASALARSAPFVLRGLGALALGFTLVTMFAAMHEAVHRTAFRSRRLNDGVAWLAGLLSFYNSTFYRPYHGWHHRFTQIHGKDPELEDRKPTDLSSYLFELSGAQWWIGKVRTYLTLARGNTTPYRFLSETTGRQVIRSVRLQLSAYGAAIAASLALGHAYFVTFWLLPVAAAQPLLRFILLAEHTGCSEDDDPLTNTRTTRTVLPVRFFMWEMPYHAEHHRYPAVPFFALATAHRALGPHLVHLARDGYLGVHTALLRTIASGGRGAAGRPPMKREEETRGEEP
jgi:fatty acid desaturase